MADAVVVKALTIRAHHAYNA